MSTAANTASPAPASSTPELPPSLRLYQLGIGHYVSRALHLAAKLGLAEGKLLIVEGVYPLRVDESLLSRGAAANDVNMLVCTGGRQRSELEFRALFEASGLRLTRILPTPVPVCVIEGMRA